MFHDAKITYIFEEKAITSVFFLIILHAEMFFNRIKV